MKWYALLILPLLTAQILFAQEQEPAAEPMTLQKAINSALKNNLNIEIEQFNPQISEAEIDLEESRFEPLFLALFNANDANRPTGSRLAGEGTVSNTNVDYNFTFQQLLKTGTFYNVVFNNDRATTNQLFTSFNPQYNSSLFANLTQPLMRNFGTEITLAPIRIAQKNRLAADHRLRTRVLDIALQVEQVYWDLVFAQRELAVRQQSLTYARDLYENNKKQVEVGTMAPLEVVVAEAEVAAREEGIIATEALINNTEDSLKTLIVGEEMVDWDTPIAPSDEPVIAPIPFSEEEAIQRGIANNPDLKSLTMEVESRNLSSKLAANALKPQLDLKGSVGFNGLGGERLLFNDDIFNPVPIGTVPGGYGDALTTMFENRTWSVGFEVGIPVGNRQAEANYVRADLAEKQSKKILENARQQLVLNIRTTMRNLQSDMKRLEAARASRVLQEKKLDAERKKLNVGLSTNNVVLDFQEDLALAQSTELRAMVGYRKNLAQLNRLLGTNVD